MADLAKILRDLPKAERDALSERMRGNEPSMSKYEANYTDTAPEGAGTCRDCTMYRDERCTLVAGIISPDGSCDHWKPVDAAEELGWEPL